MAREVFGAENALTPKEYMVPSSRPFSIVYSVTFADTLAISIFSLVSAFLNKMLNPVSLLLVSV